MHLLHLMICNSAMICDLLLKIGLPHVPHVVSSCSLLSLSLSWIAAAASVASNGVATPLRLPCLMLLPPLSLNILVLGVCHHTLLRIVDPYKISCIFHFAWPMCADSHSSRPFLLLGQSNPDIDLLPFMYHSTILVLSVSFLI